MERPRQLDPPKRSQEVPRNQQRRQQGLVGGTIGRGQMGQPGGVLQVPDSWLTAPLNSVERLQQCDVRARQVGEAQRIAIAMPICERQPGAGMRDLPADQQTGATGNPLRLPGPLSHVPGRRHLDDFADVSFRGSLRREGGTHRNRRRPMTLAVRSSVNG
jgi:hypothetical protein